MKILSLLICIIYLATISFGQDTTEINKIDKANEIIRLAQNAIYQKVKKEEVKSVFVKSEGSINIENNAIIDGKTQEVSSNRNIEEEISIDFPHKILQTQLAYTDGEKLLGNYSKIINIVNGENVSNVKEMMIDGKNVSLSDSKMNQNKVSKETIQNQATLRLFPIFLQYFWFSGMKFSFVGKAEINGVRTDVIEILTKSTRKMRYFFDEKTYLLTLISDENENNGTSIKSSTYFSDYKLFNGMFIATKIQHESESYAESSSININGKSASILNRTKIISTSIIKDFKLNIVFKNNLFNISGK